MILSENFSLDDLRSYLQIKLGSLVWRLEKMELSETDAIDAAITDAVLAYSRRCPILSFEVIQVIPNQQSYTLDNPGFGVFQCDFIEQSPVIAPFMQTLIGVTPINNLQGGDFDVFLTWQKSFKRVTSLAPHWLWDDAGQRLLIYNPSAQIRACAFCYQPRTFTTIKLAHKDFIKRYSLAVARLQLAEHRSKFPNIPGPAGKDIQLNGDKLVTQANASLEKLKEELMGMQTRPWPVWD